jgi:hypothetical protein
MSKDIAKHMVALARDIMATEFPSQEALDKYLHEHPDADRSNHSVKEQGPKAPKKEDPADNPKVKTVKQWVKTRNESPGHKKTWGVSEKHGLGGGTINVSDLGSTNRDDREETIDAMLDKGVPVKDVQTAAEGVVEESQTMIDFLKKNPDAAKHVGITPEALQKQKESGQKALEYLKATSKVRGEEGVKTDLNSFAEKTFPGKKTTTPTKDNWKDIQKGQEVVVMTGVGPAKGKVTDIHEDGIGVDTGGGNAYLFGPEEGKKGLVRSLSMVRVVEDGKSDGGGTSSPHKKVKVDKDSTDKVQVVLRANGVKSNSDEMQELAGFKSSLGQRVPEADRGKYYVRNAAKLKKDFIANMDASNYGSPEAFEKAKERMSKMPVDDFAKVLAAINEEEEGTTASSRTAGGWGAFSEDLYDAIMGIVLRHKDKSTKELIRLVKADHGLVRMMADEDMQDSDLEEMLEDNFTQFMLKRGSVVAHELLRVAKELSAWGGMPTMPRESYLPKNVDLKQVEIPDLPDLLVYTYDGTSPDGSVVNYGIAFYGKGNKPIWHFRFRSPQSRQTQIDETVRNYKAINQRKMERRQERTDYKHSFQVGDILVSSWGYDQTNIDYYEVIAVGDKTVSIREIDSKVVGDDETSFRVAPAAGHYKGPAMVKKPLPSGSVKITSYAYAHKWDGRPRSETKLEYGH